MQARFLHCLSWEILAVLFTFSKTGKPTVLISFTQLVKFIFIEHLQKGWVTDLFYKKNYETVKK